ncbi:MAG: MlaD family protein [Candidatus Marinimicrobia bacterium]|nr:MlaD family protein [Candidatus Neomarinimicrobiota bacterium]MCF7922381.1 MlaD family protein [Candidatus Neomarinimicrobiota bacterium]
MVTSTQKIRLGIFLSISSILLITTFVIVAGQRLIQKRDFYFITYQNISVTGLQSGSSVKYYGINIGQVDDISIDPEDINNVTVEISVKKGTPIKEDVLATLISVGITGIKQVELTGGTNEANLLLPGSDIQPGTSYMEDITGKAERIAEKFEILLNNLIAVTSEDNRIKVGNILTSTQGLVSEDLTKTLKTVDETFTHVDLTVLRTRQDLIQSIEALKVSAQYLSEFSRKVNDDPSLLLRQNR